MGQRFQVGDTVIYNDGRPGHVDVRGKVVEVSPKQIFVIVQFEDRANPTLVAVDSHEWMNHMTKENK